MLICVQTHGYEYSTRKSISQRLYTSKPANYGKKYKNHKKTFKKQLNVIERQLSDHEKRLSGVEDGISRITPVVERIQGYQRQEILQKITASNDIREIAKLLENAQGGVFNVKSL